MPPVDFSLGMTGVVGHQRADVLAETGAFAPTPTVDGGAIRSGPHLRTTPHPRRRAGRSATVRMRRVTPSPRAGRARRGDPCAGRCSDRAGGRRVRASEPTSVWRTLLTYAPPPSIVRRASLRDLARPLCSRASTSESPSVIDWSCDIRRGRILGDGQQHVLAERSDLLGEQAPPKPLRISPLLPRRAPTRRLRAPSARWAARRSGRSAVSVSSASISSWDRNVK